MLLTNAMFALAQAFLEDFCAKAKSGETRAKQKTQETARYLSPGMYCSALTDSWTVFVSAASAASPSSQAPNSSPNEPLAVRFAIYIAFASAVET